MGGVLCNASDGRRRSHSDPRLAYFAPPTLCSGMTEPNLNPDEKAVLPALLRDTIERDLSQLSPRVRSLKAIIELPGARPEALSPPKPGVDSSIGRGPRRSR